MLSIGQWALQALFPDEVSMRSFFSALLATVCVASAQPRYTVLPLLPLNDPTVGGGGANGINVFGDAAGSFYNPSYTERHAFSYTAQGVFTDLGISPLGDSLQVSGINDAGQIAAYGNVTGTAATTHAFRYTPGIGFVDLGTATGRSAETTGINNSGQVVGTFEMNSGSERAFRYTDGIGMEDLGTLPAGQHSGGYGINDAGWVTGSSGSQAFLYRDGDGMTSLGPGRGWAFNDAGVVAGENYSEQPVLFINGKVQLLGDVSGGAMAINNSSIAVGFTATPGLSAFVWTEQDGLQNLNTLIDPNSGWYLSTANGINDSGQIVGWGGFIDRPGYTTAFRLDPIPEPSTWALLGLGGLLSMIFHRRLKR